MVRKVRLIMIDEVHLLNERGRGAVLEALVSRMKTVQKSGICCMYTLLLQYLYTLLWLILYNLALVVLAPALCHALDVYRYTNSQILECVWFTP